MNTTWQQQFDSCDTLERWNEYVVPCMKSEGEDYKRAAAGEAKRRGYRADKIAGVYVEPAKMVATKGRNLVRVGWTCGRLYAEFHGGAVWSYEVGQEEFFKLQCSPFPDRLFALLKTKYVGRKESPAT